MKIEECDALYSNGKVYGSLRGISGAPVFVWRRGPILYPELVGFVFEYLEDLDILKIRPASTILETGDIEPMPFGG